MSEASFSCKICHSPDFMDETQGYGFDDSSEKFAIVRCKGCGIRQIYPLLSEKALGRYYCKEYYGSAGAADVEGGEHARKFSAPVEAGVRRGNLARARDLIAYLPARSGGSGSRRVLDIGCGRGYFLRAMREKGFECYGNEIADFAFPAPIEGIHLLHGAVEELPLDEGTFDCISIWHVLEHVQNPATTLSKVSALLKPGGVFAVAVPNYGSFQSKLFGRHWFHLDLPRHLYHFSREDLETLLKAHGMEAIGVSTWSTEQNPFGFVQSALNAFLAAGGAPNALYSFLKRKPGGVGGEQKPAKALSVLLTPFLLVPALLESALGALCGRGAMLNIYARKR